MIKCVPTTNYRLEFKEHEQMPLYVYYTLLGQEYETLRNEPELLRGKNVRPDYILDVLHTALNGHVKQEDTFYHNDTRVFNVRFGCGSETKLVRVCFYIDGNDSLGCNVQRGHYGKDCSDTCTHIEYEPGYRTSWGCDSLEYYGIVSYKEDYND